MISKRAVLSIFPARAWEAVSRVICELLPFSMKKDSPQAGAIPDYGVRGDHLFLPAKYASKKHFYVETAGILVIGLGIFTILMIDLAYALDVPVIVAFSGSIAFFYLIFMMFKLFVVFRALRAPVQEIGAAAVGALSDGTLPHYTVLVPLRDEAEVMEQIIASMCAIDYPKEKLHLIFTVEEYDHETRAAIERVGIPPHWQVLLLPDTEPKTKPKALNCAFLQSKGECLVIYDAEIVPEVDQLKKAVIAFRNNPEVAIFQPRLDHYNTDQNLLTRLFTIEYTFHYDMFLPGLAKIGLPIPLSGHSAHFRMDALRRVGAWDPYNVAEDCEIGMRLFRMGYRSQVLDSVSYEEAAATLSSWIKQRTRWMKGFIQTSIVHLRYPFLTLEEMGGSKNFFAFLLLVPGTVLLNLLNLVSWGVLITWLVLEPGFIQDIYPFLVLYTANIAAIIGGFLFIYLNVVALYRREKFHLLKWWFFVPVYWFLLAYATVRAAIQLVTAPHVWEKTTHGTHLR